MKILKAPLTDAYFITLFEGGKNAHYGISTSLSGTIIVDRKYIENGFQNEYFPEHKMFGKLPKMTEDDAKSILESAGLEAPYIDYVDRDKTFDSALLSFMSFVQSEKWDVANENTWLIIPKPSKQLKGKRIPIEFYVGALDFGYGNGSEKMELDVFMTAITKLSKSVTFSMRVPKFLYDKCMTDTDVEQRPKKDSIECDTLSGLHGQIGRYVTQAHNIWEMDKNAIDAKKVICINFSSGERIERDSLNHGYTGQQISTTFNFFVAYQTSGKGLGGKQLFTYKKYQSGFGSTEKGIKGIVDSGKKGFRNYIMGRPSVMIDWTQEREDFLSKLEESFRSLSVNLNNFLKDLDENKLELLIKNKELLKLN